MPFRETLTTPEYPDVFILGILYVEDLIQIRSHKRLINELEAMEARKRPKYGPSLSWTLSRIVLCRTLVTTSLR